MLIIGLILVLFTSGIFFNYMSKCYYNDNLVLNLDSMG